MGLGVAESKVGKRVEGVGRRVKIAKDEYRGSRGSGTEEGRKFGESGGAAFVGGSIKAA